MLTGNNNKFFRSSYHIFFKDYELFEYYLGE